MTCEVNDIYPQFIEIYAVRAIDSFVYMVSCNMIGRAKTKTRKFGRKELGRLYLVHEIYTAAILQRDNITVKTDRKVTII